MSRWPSTQPRSMLFLVVGNRRFFMLAMYPILPSELIATWRRLSPSIGIVLMTFQFARVDRATHPGTVNSRRASCESSGERATPRGSRPTASRPVIFLEFRSTRTSSLLTPTAT